MGIDERRDVAQPVSAAMNDRPSTDEVKVRKALQGQRKAGFKVYRELCYGKTSLAHALTAECLLSLLGPLPGAAGLLLRSKLYPCLFGSAGKKLIIGRNVTFRHLRKIRLGNNVVIDDNAVIDAKGESNEGITIGDGVFIGRNTIVYCKGGDIEIGDGVNISSSCTVFSSNRLVFEPNTMIGAYSYFLSGGEYDSASDVPFVEQSGMETKGELVIGSNCWFGARVTVLDAASIGRHCVIGAGAVVNKPIPANRVAAGVPARVIREL